MSRALVITCACPMIPERATAGIYQRFSLFMDAIRGAYDQVDLVTLAPWNADEFSALEARYNEVIKSRYGQHINLIAVPKSAHQTSNSSAWHYIKAARSVDKQSGYIEFTSPSLTKSIAQALERSPSLVFVHRLNAFTPLWPLLDKVKAALYFDMDDIEHRALFRAICSQPYSWLAGKLQVLQLPALIRRERQAIQKSQATFVCSQSDVHSLQRLAKCPRVFEIPNTVSISQTPAPNIPAPKKTLGFIGSFFHPATVDGATWLLNEIWPLIRQSVPDAVLRIAGVGAQKHTGQHHGINGVEVLDYVDDISLFYASLNLSIAPIRFGAGTRVKIIESAGYGVPVVSTLLGAEGLQLNDGQEILLSHHTQGLALLCINLLEDPIKARNMGDCARRAFVNHYDRDVIVSNISRIISNSSTQNE